MAYFGECPQQNKLKKGRASQQTITKMILYKIQIQFITTILMIQFLEIVGCGVVVSMV